MELIKKEIELPKETSEIVDYVADLVINAKEALNDGFQIGTDIPAIATKSFNGLITAVDGMDKIEDEFKSDEASFMLAWAIAGAKIYKALKAKKV